MSVGEGSIKRAAKAANAAEPEKETAAKQEDAKKAAAEKQPAKAAEKKNAEKKPAAKKAGAKKSTAKKTTVSKASAENKAPAGEKQEAGRHVIYGVGQELPIHLM